MKTRQMTFAIKRKTLLLVLIMGLCWPGYGFKGIYIDGPEQCPVCGFEEAHPLGYRINRNYYNPIAHWPLQYETQDFWPVWHCRNCKFTSFEMDMKDVYTDFFGAVKPENRLRAQKIVAQLEHLRKQYRLRVLPRHLQYEILKSSMRKEKSSIFMLRFYFILGYEYHEAGMREKAIGALERARDILERCKKEYPKNFQLDLALYSGGIHYLSGHRDQALQEYEMGLESIPLDGYHTLFWKNCFYLNSLEIQGSFWDRPLIYLFSMRNIFLLRYFDITCWGLIAAVLVGGLVIGFWIVLGGLEQRRTVTQPKMIAAFFTVFTTLIYIYSFEIHHSLFAVSLISCVWAALFVLSKTRDTFHKILFFTALSLPWLALFLSTDIFREIQRVFSLTGAEIGNIKSGLEFTIYTLTLWLPLAAAAYLIHFIFPRALVSTSMSLLLFFPASAYLMENNLVKDYYSLHYFYVPIAWYGLLILIEYGILRRIPLESPFSKRLRRMHDGAAWSVNRLFFLIYPAIILMNTQKDSLWSDLTFLPFWGLVLLGMILLHKLSNSTPMAILSLMLTFIAMFHYDNPYPQDINGPIFYFLTGVLWLSFLMPFAHRLKKNFGMRFIYVVSSAYILLPIIYAVFRMWHRWEYQFRAYFGDFYF